MRKIETLMNNAIRKRNNFSNGNTTVKTTSFFDNNVYCEESEVFLHGNHIATYNHVDKELTLFDGGWQSNTTKSRLNALCYEFATGFGVFQKNWNWFVSDFQNKTIKPLLMVLLLIIMGVSKHLITLFLSTN